MNKLSIVGAGMVGEAAAQIIAREELCRELMLIDVQGELAQGKALDVWQAAIESGPIPGSMAAAMPTCCKVPTWW